MRGFDAFAPATIRMRGPTSDVRAGEHVRSLYPSCPVGWGSLPATARATSSNASCV